ncbi:14307_t:CDS:2 [Ambispora leptoticha]|uniref:Delta(24(24(1)))-sterol reductase n=1 Tax=Ambispora leptoticha TaxID=144679 RepID=A0A9N9H2V4_9GLOM|nr:14307_t:CDS:2 [Ambispora leptoticha]
MANYITQTEFDKVIHQEAYSNKNVNNKKYNEIDEKVDSEIVFEFGGPWGVTAIMLGFPTLMYYMWGCLYFYRGQLVSPFNVEFWQLVAEGAAPTWYSTKIYVSFCLFELFLAFNMPGPIVKGAPVPCLKGKQLDYLCNGVTSWYATLILSYIVHKLGWFRLPDLIDQFGHLMTAAIISGFTITIVIYMHTILQGNQHRMSGNFFYDLFMGAVLHPRIGKVDLKMFAEIRIPWVLLFYISVSAAIKEYELFGYLSPSMGFMILAHFLYVNACMKGEECIPTTWDMIYEKFGFMLIFWNFAGVPFTYCYSTLYLHFASIDNGAPLQHSLPWTIFCYTLLLTGYYIWDTANSQKNRFRMSVNGSHIPRNTFPQLPWGTLKNPTYIRTKHGNLLLTGGWWGIARKAHYTADLMMAFAWGFITGFETAITYFYPVFFVIVLIHRVRRDLERCSKKYGKDWEEYCRRVPYIFIPGLI